MWKGGPAEYDSTDGMDCVAWDEPADPDCWDDNNMCLPKNSPFEMKFLKNVGEIGDWSLEVDCISVNRPGQGENESWHDNFFCVRRKKPNPIGSSWGPVTNLESEIRLYWSSQDRIPNNTNNIRVEELANNDCDMYLSWPNYVSPENHPGGSFVWTMMKGRGEDGYYGMNT